MWEGSDFRLADLIYLSCHFPHCLSSLNSRLFLFSFIHAIQKIPYQSSFISFSYVFYCVFWLLIFCLPCSFSCFFLSLFQFSPPLLTPTRKSPLPRPLPRSPTSPSTGNPLEMKNIKKKRGRWERGGRKGRRERVREERRERRREIVREVGKEREEGGATAKEIKKIRAKSPHENEMAYPSHKS